MHKDLFGMGRQGGPFRKLGSLDVWRLGWRQRRALFREDAKGRKGLGTSPFGPMGLASVPSPCAFAVSLLRRPVASREKGGGEWLGSPPPALSFFSYGVPHPAQRRGLRRSKSPSTSRFHDLSRRRPLRTSETDSAIAQ